MGFSYHANTLGFGGHIDERGRTKRLPSQASVTLPLEGGFGEACVADYCEAGVSFYRAESRVYGNTYRNKLFKTYANVTIYGLDLDGRVQADVLSASIISINERVNNCPGAESRISFDATIVGLVIDGHPYDVELNTKPFRDHGTFSEFTDAIAKMSPAEFDQAAEAYNLSPSDWLSTGRLQVPARCQQALRASILSKITPALKDGPELRRQGFTIEVPDLGLLHLGEVMLTVGKRGINLMRVELGRTLEDLVVMNEPEPIEELAAESLSDTPQSTVVQFAPQLLQSSSSVSGGYTVANVSGNGTDFGPP